MTKFKRLSKGHTVQLKPDEIEYVVRNMPNMSSKNFKKLHKAHLSGKGVRISVDENELEGSGFKSMVKKGIKSGAKYIKNNKNLNAFKDELINDGLDYAVGQAGLDAETGQLVKKLGKHVADQQFNELAGSGFKSMVKKGVKSTAKYVKNNKNLNAFKDELINDGLDYAVGQAGLDHETGQLVKKLGKHVADKGFNDLAGGNIFNKNVGRKILKTGAKALKVGNKISNAMGYDDLQDMAIDTVTNQTIGRIDPTLGHMASNALQKVADKQVDRYTDKYSGGSLRPKYSKISNSLEGNLLESQIRRTYPKDLSNIVHPDSDAYLPDQSNQPMFNQLKYYKKLGKGFKVNN